MARSGPARCPGAALMERIHRDHPRGCPHPCAAPAGQHPAPLHPLCQPPRANKNKLTCISINFPASIHPGLITMAIPGAGGLGIL